MMPQTPLPPTPTHFDPNLIFMQHGGPPVDQLQARLGEVESLHHRIAELEERVDFTERLLAQTQDAQSRVLPGESR